MQLELLSLLSNSGAYTQYAPFIKNYVLTDEVSQLVRDVGVYYTAHPNVEDINWDSFKTWFQVVQHPAMKKQQFELYDHILNNLKGYKPDPAIIQKIIDMDYVAQIKVKTADFLQGTAKSDPFSEISDLIEEREEEE